MRQWDEEGEKLPKKLSKTRKTMQLLPLFFSSPLLSCWPLTSDFHFHHLQHLLPTITTLLHHTTADKIVSGAHFESVFYTARESTLLLTKARSYYLLAASDVEATKWTVNSSSSSSSGKSRARCVAVERKPRIWFDFGALPDRVVVHCCCCFCFCFCFCFCCFLMSKRHESRERAKVSDWGFLDAVKDHWVNWPVEVQR